MPDAYYRISSNKSEADETLYQHNRLIEKLKVLAVGRPEGIPSFSDIRQTHRFPIKTEYRPCIVMSNDLVKHTTNTSQFITGYNGDIQAQMYLKIFISAGTITQVAANEYGWSFCRNFVPALIKKIAFKIQGDIITEFSGEVLYLYSQWFVTADRRAALMRLWRETVVELDYGLVGSSGAGGAASNLAYNIALTSYVARHPHTPLQANISTRAASHVFVPLDALALTRSLEQSFPLSPLYALERVVEFEYNDIRACINVFPTDGTPAGYVDPDFAQTVILWPFIPAITSTELYVNYILVHRDLQRILSMNGYGYVIRQFSTDSISVVDANTRELSYTKVVEWVGLIGRLTSSIARAPDTATVDVDGAGAGIITLPGATRVDPFGVAVDVDPISDVDVTARGQTFYKELTWTEMSAMFGYTTGGKDFHSQIDRSAAVVPFTQRISMEDFLGSYNSGYGPNLTFKWRATAFAAGVLTAGTLTFVLCTANAFAAYRGTATVRYT